MAEIISGETLGGEVFGNSADVIFCAGGSSSDIKRTNNLMVYITTISTVKITAIAIKETISDVSTIESISVT